MTILLFGRFRDSLGPSVTLKVTTVADVRIALAALAPELTALLAVSRIAVNLDFATDDQAFQPTDEVAIIPPVSGG
jgi:molybdopterin converting factor small subunit